MIQRLENSHNKIVSLACTGNQEDCEELIDMLYTVIEPIVRKHLSTGEEKQDVLQEVFMKIFCNLNQYSGRAPIHNWSSKIALNTCYDRLRKKRIRPDLVYGENAGKKAARPRINPLRSRSYEYELIDELINDLLSNLNEVVRIKSNVLSTNNRLLDSLNYKKTLNRGYAIIKDQDESIIENTRVANQSNIINIMFSDGEITVKNQYR